MEIDLFIDRHWFTYKKGDSLLRFRADKFYHVECWGDDDEAMDDDAYYDLKEEVIEALDDFEPCIIYFGDDNETYRITDLPEFLEQTSDGSETILNNRQLKSVEEAVDFIKNLKTVAFGEIEHLLVPLPKKEKWSEKRVKFNNGQLLRLIVDLHDGDFGQTLLSYGKLENWETSEVTDIELKTFVMSLYHHFTFTVSQIFWLAQVSEVPDKELIKEEIERHKEELLPKSITLLYYHELSKFLIKKDYVSEAISMLEKELRLENIEYYKSYYYTLANAYFSLKNYDKALHYCDIIINSDPSDINAYETYILRSQTKMILSDNSDAQEDIAFAEKIKERYDELQADYDEMRLYLSDYLWAGEDIKNSWDQNNIEVSLLSPDQIRFFHELYGNLNDGKKAKGQINEQARELEIINELQALMDEILELIAKRAPSKDVQGLIIKLTDVLRDQGKSIESAFLETPEVYENISDQVVQVSMVGLIYLLKEDQGLGPFTRAYTVMLENLRSFKMSPETEKKIDENLRILLNKEGLTSKNLSKDSDGCYIATMVYKDYDHPKVLVLRNFRDTFLSKNFLGRVFIRFYYKFSPSLVELLEGKKGINKMIKKTLNFIIKIVDKKKS